MNLAVLFGLVLFFGSLPGISCGDPSLVLPKQVHAFMYLWYGNPETDGKYLHWDHEVLPHWEERVNAQYPEVGMHFQPPENIHSPYYPLHGTYSSNDRELLSQQFTDMTEHGIEVAVVSWWGQRDKDYATDTQGVNTDEVMANLLKVADEHPSGIKIAIHMEPYSGRSVESVKADIEYVHMNYGKHPSLLRSSNDGRIVYYVYDSYHISSMYWSRLLTQDGDITIRGTNVDGVMIGLWLHHHHGRDLASAGFDGIYSYFGSDGFSYGSTSTNWGSMCRFAVSKGMLCNLSVGPGYVFCSIIVIPLLYLFALTLSFSLSTTACQHSLTPHGTSLTTIPPQSIIHHQSTLYSHHLLQQYRYNDTLIRPWNAHHSRGRLEGRYYERMWKKAMKAAPHVVSITSYNEWGEGTQIEPARSFYLPYIQAKEARLLAQKQESMTILSEFGGEAAYKSPSDEARDQLFAEAKDPAFRAIHTAGKQGGDTTVNRHFDDYGREGPYFYLMMTKRFSREFRAESDGEGVQGDEL
jgi:hypothetical protein